MRFRERLKTDIFLNFNLTQFGVTIIGGLVIFLIGLMAVPGVMNHWWEPTKTAFVIMIFLGLISLAATWRYNLALLALSRSQSSGEDLPEPVWDLLRKASFDLPLRLLLLTFILWPLATLSFGAWLMADQLLSPEEAIRGMLVGPLYCPIQGMILFYSTRHSLRRMGPLFREAGQEWSGERRGWLGMQGKLMMSFAFLAVVPLLAGVLINGVQNERAAMTTNLDQVCGALEEVQASCQAPFAGEDWESAVGKASGRNGIPEDTHFMVAAASKKIIFGNLPRAARREWRNEISKGPKKGECRRLQIPGKRQFVVMRFFEDPGVWISAVTSPFPKSSLLWGRIGLTLALVAIIMSMGVLLGFLAAQDVGSSIKELKEAAGKAAAGDFVQVTRFLPDDEMSELAVGFNTLVASIHGQLSHSSELIARVRQVIEGLNEQTAGVSGIADQQREVINEQTALAREASKESQEVTRTAGEIKERAHAARHQMSEASESCLTAQDILNEVTEVVSVITQSSQRIATQMEVLEVNYHRMDEVVKIIEDVAERTQMLALNAALEAGAEGKKGSRFSVVAGEVQRLSEKISEQAKTIRKLFFAIRKSSLESAQAIDEGKDRADEGPKWITKLGQSLEGIQRRTSAAAGSMQQIADMTDQQSRTLEQMKIIVSEIQSVTSVVDDMSTGAEKMVERLDKLADHLRELVREDEAGTKKTDQGRE